MRTTAAAAATHAAWACRRPRSRGMTSSGATMPPRLARAAWSPPRRSGGSGVGVLRLLDVLRRILVGRRVGADDVLAPTRAVGGLKQRGVVAGAAVDAVALAVARADGVVAAAAADDVAVPVTGAADVGARERPQRVVATAAADAVAPAVGEDGVVSPLAERAVVALAAGDQVVAQPAVDAVVARAPAQPVGAAAAMEAVVAGEAEHAIVAPAGEHAVVEVAPAQHLGLLGAVHVGGDREARDRDRGQAR